MSAARAVPPSGPGRSEVRSPDSVQDDAPRRRQRLDEAGVGLDAAARDRPPSRHSPGPSVRKGVVSIPGLAEHLTQPEDPARLRCATHLPRSATSAIKGQRRAAPRRGARSPRSGCRSRAANQRSTEQHASHPGMRRLVRLHAGLHWRRGAVGSTPRARSRLHAHGPRDRRPLDRCPDRVCSDRGCALPM